MFANLHHVIFVFGPFGYMSLICLSRNAILPELEFQDKIEERVHRNLGDRSMEIEGGLHLDDDYREGLYVTFR